MSLKLVFDAETGAFWWKLAGKTRLQAGPVRRDIAGLVIDGRAISHTPRMVLRLRLLATRSIDHKNGDRDDNRIVNLREATRSENN